MDQTLPSAERSTRTLSRRAQDSDPFLSLNREMTRLFDDMVRGFGLPALRGAFAAGFAGPRVDARETQRDLLIEAELPGVERSEIDVSLTDELLTIRGEKRAEDVSRGEGYHIAERAYGAFSRTIRLPFVADPDKVDASFANGMLTIRLPKPDVEARRQRRIDVKAGSRDSGPGTQRAPAAGMASQGGGHAPGAAATEAAKHLGQQAEAGGTSPKPGTARTAQKSAS